MKSSKLLGLWVLIGLCLSALPACAQGAVTFTFHPPDDGITIVQTEKTTKTDTKTANGQSDVNVEETTFKTRVKYAKTPTGYSRTETTISVVHAENGQTTPDLMRNAMLDRPIVIDMDPTGKVIGIHGMDTIRERMLATMVGEPRDLFDKYVTLEKLDAYVKESWEGTRNPLLGQTKHPGDSWTASVNTPIFSSNLSPLKETLTLQQAATVLGRPCAVVKSVANPDLKALTRDLRVFFNELEMFPKNINPAFAVQSYVNESTDTIDLALLLELTSSSVETKTYTVTANGLTIACVEEEKSTTTSEYEPAWHVDFPKD